MLFARNKLVFRMQWAPSIFGLKEESFSARWTCWKESRRVVKGSVSWASSMIAWCQTFPFFMFCGVLDVISKIVHCRKGKSKKWLTSSSSPLPSVSINLKQNNSQKHLFFPHNTEPTCFLTLILTDNSILILMLMSTLVDDHNVAHNDPSMFLILHLAASWSEMPSSNWNSTRGRISNETEEWTNGWPQLIHWFPLQKFQLLLLQYPLWSSFPPKKNIKTKKDIFTDHEQNHTVTTINARSTTKQ